MLFKAFRKYWHGCGSFTEGVEMSNPFRVQEETLREINETFRQIRQELHLLRSDRSTEIQQLKDFIMSAIDDLKQAMTDLVTEAVTDLEAVIAKLAATSPDNTAEIQALTKQAQDTTAKLKEDMAAMAPAPVPAPAAPADGSAPAA